MTQAIAAAASLAMAVKLKKLFEEPDKFLTFPVGLGFPLRYFDFVKDPAQTTLSAQEQLNYKADFARQMGMVPADQPLFSADASTLLWEHITNILNGSVFADSALTAEEEAQLAEAVDFLSDDGTGPDGTKIPINSPQVNKYYEYKTVYEEAARAYLDAQLSVKFASGDEGTRLRAEWDAYRDKQLAGVRDKAEQDWLNLGFKRQVEDAQARKNSLEVRKYLTIYAQDYLNEMRISEITDLTGHGIGFLNTFFSPLDAFEPTQPWASVTLTRTEVEGLLREASPALKAVFGNPTQEVDGVEVITLEYNKVVVMRPWCREEFFASRYWKLADGSLVCDGQSPRGGSLPAIISSMVVARNVRVTRRKVAPQQPVIPPPTLPATRPVVPVALGGMPLRRPVPVMIARPTPGPIAPVHAAAPATPVPVRPPVAGGAIHAATPAAMMVVNRTPVARTTFVRAAPVAQSAMIGGPRPPTQAPPTAQLQAAYAGLKYAGTTIRTPVADPSLQRVLAEDPRLKPGSVELVTDTIALDGVAVLALVCKRLPKCPDPDPSLQW